MKDVDERKAAWISSSFLHIFFQNRFLYFVENCVISTPIILQCRNVADSYRGARRGLSGASSSVWFTLVYIYWSNSLFLISFLFLSSSCLSWSEQPPRGPSYYCFAVSSKPEQWTTNIIPLFFHSYVVQFYCIKNCLVSPRLPWHVRRTRVPSRNFWTEKERKERRKVGEKTEKWWRRSK